MDSTDINTVVNLDELNKKQRSKEYKATLKLLKSKESINRTIAIQKFNLDQRYLLEGSCLIPLIESAFPKKKTLEHTKAALETLTSFVNRQVNAESLPNGVASLSIILEESGNLNVLEIISNLLTAKEELTPKTKKNVDTTTIAKNEDQYPFFRRESLHLIYSIISQLLLTKNVDSKIIQFFVKTPSLLVNLCEGLKGLAIQYEDESKRTNMIQEGVWNLTSIEFLIRNNPTVNVELFLQQDVVHSILVLAKEKNYTLYCLHILGLLSENPVGLKKLSEIETMDLNYDLIESAVNQLITKPINISNTPVAKEKEKVDKSKKKPALKEEIIPVGKEIPMYNNSTDPDKLSVIYLKLIVIFLTKVARQVGGEAFPQHSIEKMVDFLSKAMLEPKVWEIARTEAHNDILLDDLIESICILFGCLGQIGSNSGIAAAKAGAAKSLLNIMQVSRAVFGLPLLQPVEPLQMDKTTKADKNSKEKGSTPRIDKTPRADSVSADSILVDDDTAKLGKVLNLRKVSEKAILHLATYPTKIDNNGNSSINESNDMIMDQQVRWKSCSFFETNVDLCVTSVTAVSASSVAALADKGNSRKSSTPIELPPQPLAPVSITTILELVTNIDTDLSDRGIKLLAALMQGSKDSTSFNKNTGLENASIINKLTSVAERCGAGMLAYADSLTNHLTMRALSGLSVTGSPGRDNDDVSVVSQVVPCAAPDIPPCAEYFVLSLMCIEPLVALSADSINAFSTEAILSILAGVLYNCGPTGSSNTKAEGGGNGNNAGIVDVDEIEVKLHDPRESSWLNEPSSDSDTKVISNGSTIKLRRLILNLLTKILSTDSVFRTYEGDKNVEPGLPAPESTSPTSEALGLIFKLCSDPVVGILLTDTIFAEKSSILSTLPSEEKRIENDVLNASLEFFLALASNGIRGVALTLESIANPKLLSQDSVGEKKKLSSLTGLKDFLYYIEVDDTAVDSFGNSGKSGDNIAVGLPGGKANLSSSHIWKYPQYFDQIMANGSSTVITSCNHILETPLLWPIVTVCGAVLGIIGNPIIDNKTAELALKLLNSLIFSKLYQAANQPALYDIFSAVVLSMGGGVILASAVGRFGILKGNSLGLESLNYLFGRGATREQFWKKYALSKSVIEPTVIDKKGGKAVTKAVKESAGKDKAKEKAKVAKGGKSAITPEEDFSSPYEPDETHPDPNHGPDTLFWKNLLCIPFDDLHSRSVGVYPLSCCLQAGLSDCVLQLIEVGVSVNDLDGCGMAPLMYALLLGDEVVLNSLIQAGADLDALDGSGNPAVKYAFFSITSSLSLLNDDTSFDTEHCLTVNEEPSLLGVLVDAGVDLVVCDAQGSNPLHFALGLETLRARLGGKNIVVKRDAYSCESFRESTYKVVKFLLESGANVNICNKSGMIPLHIAAAYCDFSLVELLLEHGSPETSNTLDTAGFLPIHYAFAGCLSDDCFAVVKLLLERGGGRALYPSAFCDGRTGKSKLDKYLTEVEAVLSQVLDEALYPAAIVGKRLSVTELLQVRTRTDLNCFHLTFAGGLLTGIPLLIEIASQVPEIGFSDRRITTARQLLELVESEGESSVTGVDMLGTLMQQSDLEGFTMLHAISLVKGLSSEYDELLQTILQFSDANNLPLCSHDVVKLLLPVPWTPLHAALANDNKLLVQSLLSHGADIGAFNYVHFLSVCEISEGVASSIIQAAATDANYQQLLNGERNAADTRDKGWGSPLHLAVRLANKSVIYSLMHCSKVNPMAKDSDSGESPLLECCRMGRVDLVEALAVDKDRLDLLAQDNNSKNCIDIALEQQNVELMDVLIRMRRNDVVEYVLSKIDGKELTILKRLELENISLAKICGVEPISKSPSLDPPPPLSDAPLVIESGETISESQNSQQNINIADEDVSMTLDDDMVVDFTDNSLSIDALNVKLDSSNKIIQLLLSALTEVTNVTDITAHAHECFAKGKLYGSL